MPPVTVYYHADCLDGFGAAYAAWRRFGNAACYRPMHHGEPWHAAEIDGHAVHILDFSFPAEQLADMATHAASVTQIDHHASARAPWSGHLQPTTGGAEEFRDAERRLHLRFDLGKSGARLAWEFFHPDRPLPPALAHIEDQDLWRFALPGTRAFCRALRLLPFAFADWDAMVRATTDADAPGYARMLADGGAIEGYFRREVERLADGRLAMPARLRGEPVDAMLALRHGQAVLGDGERCWLAVEGIAVNANVLFASELGHLLAERSGSFGLIWQISGDGEAKVSLRSQGDFDVAAIAVRYGGGGHRNAAGFRLPAGQFLEEVLGMVPGKGLEPPRLAAPEPKSGASTNFATRAGGANSSTD